MERKSGFRPCRLRYVLFTRCEAGSVLKPKFRKRYVAFRRRLPRCSDLTARGAMSLGVCHPIHFSIDNSKANHPLYPCARPGGTTPRRALSREIPGYLTCESEITTAGLTGIGRRSNGAAVLREIPATS